MKKTLRKTALIVLQIIFALCVFTLAACNSSCSSCSDKNINPEMPDNATTTRAPAPTDGSKPTDHTPQENVAYMAYVLDNQPFYHAYANNSTKSTGYEQVTQTWKDYKSEELSGKNAGIMVCSDVSYSALVKSASQSCFVGSDSVYMRNGAKPSKTSTATTVDWSVDQPSYYSKDDYLKKYGEFSTELTVYAINKETIAGTGEVIDNGDGTYSQTLSLNSDAACWYQYGMKTRGGLKTYPEFEKIEITFTFDAKWQVLSTYCEEKAKIAPSALGGIAMGSTSKTTTTFDYSESGFDNVHYAYFTDYFDKYVGEILVGGEENKEPEFLDVIAGGFSKALSSQGQQFDLSLTLGETDYDGKIYLKVENLDVSTLELRLALGKKDSGNQDLYAEYKDGVINLYYSDGFAATADINKVAASVTRFSDWINKTFKDEEEPSAQAEEQSSGINLESLLAIVNDGFGYDDNSAWVAIESDNLLDLGVGVNLRIDFSREKTEEGDKYDFTQLKLSAVSYGGEKFDLGGEIVPSSDSEIISRSPADTYADIADYIDGVRNLLEGGKYSVNVRLDGADTNIQYIKDVKLEATALLNLSEDFRTLTVSVPLTVNYAGLTVKLNAYYTLGFDDGNYGDVYLHLTEIGGKAVDAKIYCNIKDTADAVTKLINYFKPAEPAALSEEEDGAAVTVAGLVNKVLSLDFGAIVKEIKGSSKKIELGIGVDEVLKALDIDLGMEIGTVTLSLALSGSSVSLEGSVPALGFSLGVSASQSEVYVPSKEDYADVTKYVNGVYNLLNSPVYSISLAFVNSGLDLNATTLLKLENNYNDITVYAPVNVSYGGVEVSLVAYYTVNLQNKNYGEVYLSVETLNGEPVGARVYCDISETVDAVKEIIAMFKPAEEDVRTVALSEDGTDVVAEVIGKVLSIDYVTLIKQLKADATGIDIAVDADYLLGEIGVALGEKITLGTLSLKITLDENEAVSLTAKLPDMGVELTVGGTDREIPAPDKTQYLDVCEVLELVKRAAAEVKAIMDDGQVMFSLDTALTVDGVKMSVQGDGEVIWKNGKIRVAVEADLTISEGGAGETLALKLVYDEDNTDENGTEIRPLAKFTVNSLGMEIYRRDLNEISEGFNEILASVKNIVRLFAPATDNAVEEIAAQSEEVEEENSFSKLLDIIFGEISKVTVSLVKAEEEGKLGSLVVTYAQNATLSLSADGGLSINSEIVNNGNTQILALNACVRSVGENDDKFDGLDKEFANGTYTFYTAEKSGDFTKAIYEYVIDVFESLTVRNLLGTDTYTVNLVLDGAKSGIDGLEGIYLEATAKYTDDADGKKLMELEAEMDINGTNVKFSAVYYDKKIYVTVYNVGDTYLSNDGTYDGLKIMASGDDIYKAAEAVVKIIKNKNLSAIIDMLAPADGESAVQAEDSGVIPDEKTEFALTDIINALFTLDIRFGKSEDGTLNTLTVNIDKALEKFGLGFGIGTVTVSVNPKTHDIYASAVKEEEWLSLSAKALENTTPVTFDTAGYLDISFAANIANDINTTLDNIQSADGKPDIRLSYKGEIKINIDLSTMGGIAGTLGNVVDIEFKDATVTAGIDKDGDFYVTLYGQVQKATAKGLITVIGTARYVSLTYSNGYITLGRDVNTSSAIYKIMTLDYLLDNLLVKGDDAPIRWWLGISNSGMIKVWDLIAGNVNVPISSNLTKIDEYYVFDPSLNKVEEEPAEKKFTLSDLLNAIVVDGNSVFGDGTNLNNKFGLNASSKYYGFDVNGEKLLGSTLPTLYAAILHDDTNGISGLLAHAVVAGVINADVTLNTVAPAHVSNYFKTVTEANGDIKFDYNANNGQYTEIFGCYNSENGSYSYSRKYSDVKLTVLDGEENVVAEKTLKHGSKIYVVEEITENDDGSKNIYVDGNGNDVTTVRFEDENAALIGYGFYLENDIIIKPYKSYPGAIEYYYGTEKCQDDGHLFSGQALDECTYTVAGKTFAGWHTEPELENYVTSSQAGCSKYYAKFIDTNATAENGVIYTFSRDITQPSGGYYTATGFDKNSADKDYSDVNNTLFIPDSYAGYPVTKIGNGAFYGKGVNFKNVVVGKNVTFVDAEAFRDNKGMQTAVFLADVITFGGSSYGADGSRYVFLGSASEGDDSVADINIYYNKLPESIDANWCGFKRGNSNSSGSNIPANQLHSEGTWAYVDYTVSGYENEIDFAVNGVNTSAYTAEEIRNAILAELDEKSSVEGYLNRYEVTVSDEVVLNGKRYGINVEIQLKDANEWLYMVTASGSFGGVEKPVTISGEVTLYEGKYFAAVGAIVELRPAAGLVFANLLADEYGNYVFEMQAEKINVAAEYKKKPIEEITLVSETAFVYNGASVADNAYNVSVDAHGETVLGAATAEGYTFIGWAYDAENNGNLVFTDGTFTAETVKSDVYYAIWAVNRDDGVTFVNNTQSGDTIASVSVAEEGKGSFYAWYTKDDTEYMGNEITTITVSDTILRARLKYTLDIQMYGSNSKFYIVNETTGSSNNQAVSKKNTAITTAFDKFVIYDKDIVNITFNGNYTYINVSSSVGNFNLKIYVNTYTTTLGISWSEGGEASRAIKGCDCVMQSNAEASKLQKPETKIDTVFNVSNDIAVLLNV